MRGIVGGGVRRGGGGGEKEDDDDDYDLITLNKFLDNFFLVIRKDKKNVITFLEHEPSMIH